MVAAEPPVVVAGKPDRAYRARLVAVGVGRGRDHRDLARDAGRHRAIGAAEPVGPGAAMRVEPGGAHLVVIGVKAADQAPPGGDDLAVIERDLRSEEHTSELQSLMRISYAVFCLKKKK